MITITCLILWIAAGGRAAASIQARAAPACGITSAAATAKSKEIRPTLGLYFEEVRGGLTSRKIVTPGDCTAPRTCHALWVVRHPIRGNHFEEDRHCRARGRRP